MNHHCQKRLILAPESILFFKVQVHTRETKFMHRDLKSSGRPNLYLFPKYTSASCEMTFPARWSCPMEKHTVFPNSWHSVGFLFSLIQLTSFKTSFLRAEKWSLCGLSYTFFLFFFPFRPLAALK